MSAASGRAGRCSTALSVLVPLAYLPSALLLLASAVVFLLFLRAVAVHVGSKRQGWSVLYGAERPRAAGLPAVGAPVARVRGGLPALPPRRGGAFRQQAAGLVGALLR